MECKCINQIEIRIIHGTYYTGNDYFYFIDRNGDYSVRTGYGVDIFVEKEFKMYFRKLDLASKRDYILEELLKQ